VAFPRGADDHGDDRIVTPGAVFFDAGGTLVDPHPAFTDLLSRTLREEGFDVSPDEIAERLPLFAEHFDRAARDGELWTTSDERSRAFWGGVYRALMTDLDLPFPDLLAERIYSVFTDPSNYRLFPDVVPVLEKLDESGITMGVISNFERWLERLLDHLEVAAHFEIQVISGVEGIEKPDPAIFLLALDRACVDPAEAVYVGDNVTFDMEPASSVGMHVVLIDRGERHADFPGPRITSLDELPGMLGL
jgi:putative hydrolase of the HAD superfamily